MTAMKARGQDKPIKIGSRLEIFVDRLLVEQMDGLEFRLHEPQREPLPASPVIGSYMTVILDDGIYRAYYRGDDPGYTGGRNFSGHPGEITCYAESRDGREWIFPKLGLLEIDGTRENNTILAGLPPFSHNFSPFLDMNPAAKPEERFKAIAGHPGSQAGSKDGLHTFVSADGIRWRKSSPEPVIPYDPSWSHAFDSQNVAFWSETEQLYMCYFRTWTAHEQSASKDAAGKSREAGYGLRSISRAASPDFMSWSAPVAMNPNLPGEHLYTSQAHPYFRAPHIYVALPSRYIAGRVGAEKADAMKGSTDILFMASRAGSDTFERLFTEAFIRPGLDHARWESRANYVALNVVPTGADEISIYHSSSGHRYTLRTDGFISVRAGSDIGELLTKPIVFNGAELVVNFSTSAGGSLSVEITDAAGAPLSGLHLDDCIEIVGDAVEHTVKWKNMKDLSASSGRPVRLRFVMKEANLFSFRFRESR